MFQEDMMAKESMGRRNFLKRSAGIAALGVGLSGCASTRRISMTAQNARRRLGANDRIAIAIVGTGAHGTKFIHQVNVADKKYNANAEIVAVCDLWRVWRHRAKAITAEATGKTPQDYVRYPDMLEKAKLDGVIVATPDFWHVPVLLDCVKAGKDVYVEKPLSYDLAQAKAGRDAVKATGAVVQVGTQMRSSPRLHAARDYVKSGRLGKISTIETAFNDCSQRWLRKELCNQIKEKDFDWEFYLRDREYRPFNPRQAMEWRLFHEFTMGSTGILGSHRFDAVNLIMDVDFPDSAVSQGGVYVWKDGRETEDTVMSLIDYPQEFILHYTSRFGNNATPGLLLRGVNGTLDAFNAEVSGAGGNGRYKLPDDPEKLKLKESTGHDHILNFLECMRSRNTPNASIDHGYQHAVAGLLAIKALREERKVRYCRKSQGFV